MFVSVQDSFDISSYLSVMKKRRYYSIELIFILGTLGFIIVILALFIHFLRLQETSGESKPSFAQFYLNASKNENNISTFSRWFSKPEEFENFNNETGEVTNTFIVPNIIHFLRFDQPDVTFIDAVCILAAFKNHKPDLIYFHTNVDNFLGPHWQHILNTPGFVKKYKINKIQLPATIFDQVFSANWHKPHASDVTRIRILMQYGGIFLDNDSYVIKSLDKYRYFEMTLNWDEGQYLGTQTLLAHHNARFLKMWLESYRGHYNSSLWYYNAGERPTIEVLNRKPELIHRVKGDFGADTNIAAQLYSKDWKDWRNISSIHLFANHRSYMFKEDYEKFPEFNEINIFNYNHTFGEMAREAYFG